MGGMGKEAKGIRQKAKEEESGVRRGRDKETKKQSDRGKKEIAGDFF